MKYFFHAETEKYTKRLHRMITLVMMSVFAVCVFCTVNVVLNIGSDINILWISIIGGFVFLGLVFSFTAAYFTDKYTRRHNKYTYFDFFPKGMVFSEYAGEFVHFGSRIILRRLYYIPFEKPVSVARNPKVAPHNITISGEIRSYLQETNRLGYHITEDGDLLFDSAELNHRLFEKIPVLEIKDRFGNTKLLEKAVAYYLEQYRNIPEKKPFDISAHVALQRKKKPRTSNPALDSPSYNRNWK